MDKGIIEEELLAKDIELIELYLNEENTSLKKICDTYTESLDDYKSTMNTNTMLSAIESFENCLEDILLKRKKYVSILNKVIEQYHNLGDETKERFSGDEEC